MVTNVENNAVTNAYETEQTEETKKKSNVSGATIGEPELSDKASKYYEKLKNKFSNMDFILVSKDQKETAKAQAGNYANANHMVVLIDEEKLEKMASDESFRNKYEGIIAQAGTQMPQLQSSLGSASSNVKTFGIQMNDDGTASYFAVLKKDSEAHTKKVLEKKKAQKAQEKKTAEKKAAQKQADKVREQRRSSVNDIHNRYDRNFVSDDHDDAETITVSASSMEGLIQKVKDVEFDNRSDQIQTEKEKQVGQHIDFRM